MIKFKNLVKTNMICKTNGSSMWSGMIKSVKIVSIQLNYLNTSKDFGELIAVFDSKTWNDSTDGLIYTDNGWLKDFRNNLIKKGLPKRAAYDIDYSEQGMQGKNYVSLDVGKPFLRAVGINS